MLERLTAWASGHAWTVAGDLRHRISPHKPPPGRPFVHLVDDAEVGEVRLGGFMHRVDHARTLIIAVHGLGGDANSGYCIQLAQAAAAREISCLRLSLRGADGSGDDLYHAGLTDDLASVLARPDVAAHDRIFVVGFSLGGHVTLRLALEHPDRLNAVVAVSAPLDLALSCQAIDRVRASVYRHAVLGSLKHSYRQMVRRHGGGSRRTPLAVEALGQIRTIHGWDEAIVVPRHGFESVAHYHRSMSVASRLSELAVPALYVGARHDPMVPIGTLDAALECASPTLTTHFATRGGHVALPTPPELHPSADLPAAVVSWLEATR